MAFTGAIQELEKHGYSFKTFVGTSAGSIAAVFLAAGANAEYLEKIMRRADFKKFKDANFASAIYNLLTKGGMYPGDHLVNWVTEELRGLIKTEKPDLTLAMIERETNKRVQVFASRPDYGTIVFDSRNEPNQNTPAPHAVRLSSSIPAVFIPREHDGIRIFDGGILNNFPVDAYLKQDDAEVNFIALYIGTDSKKGMNRRWWLTEVIDLLLSRDERLNIIEHHDRTVIIDTCPISTTDFDVSEEEKQFLVLAGRVAAQDFLGLPEAERIDAEKLLGEKRRSILRKRRIQKFRRLCRNAVSLVLLAAIAFAGYVVFKRNDYSESQGPVFSGTYLSASARGQIVRPLIQSAIRDIRVTDEKFPRAFEDDAVHFDSTIQVVAYTNTGTIKLVMSKGVFDGNGELYTSASHPAGNVSVDAALYVDNGGDISHKRLEFRHLKKNGNSQLNRAIEVDLPCNKGDNIFFLTIAHYGNAFVADAEQQPEIPVVLQESWTVVSHRSLQDHGTAAYIFLGDKPSNVRVSPHFYRRIGDGKYSEILPPSSGVTSQDAWDRSALLREFCAQPTVLNAFKADQQEMIKRVVSELKEPKDLPRHFAFTFDRANTKRLDATPDDMNLLIFAEKFPGVIPVSQATSRILDESSENTDP